MSVSAIIVAGGTGSRFGGTVPKQYQVLGDRPILAHTLHTFINCSSITNITVVAAREWIDFVRDSVVTRFKYAKVDDIVVGGDSRQASVFAGIKALKRCEVAVVHDAVRPFVAISRIAEVVESARAHRAAILAVRPRDTIKKSRKQSRNEIVEQTLQRQQLWAVQTPQAFEADLLLRAHEQAIRTGLVATDDSALVEALGVPVTIVEGDYTNIKITEPMDFVLAQLILEKGL